MPSPASEGGKNCQTGCSEYERAFEASTKGFMIGLVSLGVERQIEVQRHDPIHAYTALCRRRRRRIPVPRESMLPILNDKYVPAGEAGIK